MFFACHLSLRTGLNYWIECFLFCLTVIRYNYNHFKYLRASCNLTINSMRDNFLKIGFSTFRVCVYVCVCVCVCVLGVYVSTLKGINCYILT